MTSVGLSLFNYQDDARSNKHKIHNNNSFPVPSRVFTNAVLRGIFGPKRDEVGWECRKLHNEELNELYCSPNIVRVIKSRKMRWAGNVARMGGEERCTQGFGG